MDFGFGVLDFGFWVLDFGFWALGLGFWILGVGFWILDFEFWGSGAPAAGAASRGLQGRFLEAPGRVEVPNPRLLEAPQNLKVLQTSEAPKSPANLSPKGPWRPLEALGSPLEAPCGRLHKILSVQENGN